MQLVQRNTWSDREFTCELTEKLDELAKIGQYNQKYKTNEMYTHCYKHYIYATKNELNKKGFLAIRVPGGTVGELEVNEDMTIKSIIIDTNYVVKTYPSDINNVINELFIGQKIEYDDIINQVPYFIKRKSVDERIAEILGDVENDSNGE